MHSYQKLSLDQSLNFHHIIDVLKENFGFCFLEDNQQPFIGVLPKLLWAIDKKKLHCCFERQIDFSYISVQKSCEISVANQNQYQANGFQGGYICFISYDYARKKFTASPNQSSLPSFLIGEYDIFLKKEADIWHLYVSTEIQHVGAVKDLYKKLMHSPVIVSELACVFADKFQPRWSKQQYLSAFETVKNYIYAGDCYQINLTQEFSSKLKSGKLLSLLPEMLTLSQAPYAGYIAFEDFELLSCSPELFIEFSDNRILKTRPIKGTLPRGINAIEDERLKQQLADSEKDQAENLMIVDLLRNDLSMYAETGSVKTPKLFEIESFAQVHHMVSEIHATLKPEVNPFDVLMSALPGGSITGAPKIRAMEIIDEIEGKNRGAYCGSLGYFNYDGTGRFNILIRSIQRYGDDVSVWAGGGITVASNVDAEYQETLDKVSAILNVLNQYVDYSTS